MHDYRLGPVLGGGASGVNEGTYLEAKNGEKHVYDLHGGVGVGTTETIDLANGNVHRCVLDENVTFTFTGYSASYGNHFTLVVVQDGSGGNAITWPAAVTWTAGAIPAPATTAGNVTVFEFLTLDGGTTVYGWVKDPFDVDGAVIGPSSATDGRLAAYNGTTGKIIKELTFAQVWAALSGQAGASVSLNSQKLTSVANGTAAQDAATWGQTVQRTAGGVETIKAHGNTGSTETIDVADGNVHTAAQDQSCTYTFTNPANASDAASFLLIFTSVTGSATWPASVKWPSGAAPTLSGVTLLSFVTVDGGTTWRGAMVGSGFA